MEQLIDHYLAHGYQFGAPSLEAEMIDMEQAEGMRCKCGGRMRYAGFHREGSYIALAICDGCGAEREF